jgi:hypothetical protein
MQYRVSDHFPLWVEFACRPEEEIRRAQEKRKFAKQMAAVKATALPVAPAQPLLATADVQVRRRRHGA